MEFEGTRRTPPAINLSPLIDVVFILVIFIVLAASFQHIRELTVSLPEADAEAAPDAEALLVVVHEDGALLLDDAPIAPEALGPALQARRSAYPSLVVAADGAVALERAVFVLNAATQAGFEDVSLATKELAR